MGSDQIDNTHSMRVRCVCVSVCEWCEGENGCCVMIRTSRYTAVDIFQIMNDEYGTDEFE